MFTFNITDRRLNPHGKSLNNRQRFVERVKSSVKQAVGKQLRSRDLQDKSDAEVSVSRDGIDEPNFRYSTKNGQWDYVLPGNKDYVVDDVIRKPQGGEGGRGSDGSPTGEGEDDFRFYISYQEYLDAILEDLCLPDMIKATQKETVSYTMKRAGYTTVGATTALALERTMIQGIGRRIALKAPKLARIAELEKELEQTTDAQRRQEIQDEISRLKIQAEAISFLEKSDLRFNNFIRQPNPISKAVMFCLMDVSGSMTEHMKDLAKRFYLLLYVFLTKQYKHVDIVFIRHTHTAGEVDQDTFFNSPETGGTIVSTAYKEMQRVLDERYDAADWNIYMAQASDGDNTSSDEAESEKLLSTLLPVVQYATYVEVGSDSQYYSTRESEVWQMFDRISKQFDHVACRKLKRQADVVEVFRSLFKKTQAAAR